ncbi:MAG: class I SAM-dependent methyltransferase [Planctomycetota bacterium]|jgi:SAM-dependent methyltransferase
MGRTITPDEAAAFYARLGPGLDRMRKFEDRARLRLARRGDFGAARSVFEFGSGTGRLAELLLSRFLPADARYLGVDVSPRMVEVARARFERFGRRAEVELSDGSMRVPGPAGRFDRFVAAYVLDLLSYEDARALMGEAHRALVAGGTACLVSLTHGVTPVSRLVSSVWGAVQSCAPARVGGCRPVRLVGLLPRDEWNVRCREVLVTLAVPAEVVVAERVDPHRRP